MTKWQNLPEIFKIRAFFTLEKGCEKIREIIPAGLRQTYSGRQSAKT